MYKLVVLDLDGTTLNNRGKITNNTKNAIQQLQNKGIMVTTCTGRNLKTTYSFVKELGLTIPFLCIDGTMMYDVDQSILYRNNLSYQEAETIIDIVQAENVYVEVVSDYYYKYVKNKSFRQYDFDPKDSWLHRIRKYYTGRRYVKDLEILFQKLQSTQTEIHQVVVGGEQQFIHQVRKKIDQQLGHQVEMRDQLWGDYLFIHKPKVRKSVGVQVLCDYLGIEIENVLAIGDQRNDIDMLESVGLGIAMGNAVDEVKEVAKDITLTNEQDGVAYALEHYLLKESPMKRISTIKTFS